MIEHVYRRAEKATRIDRVVVATDDDRILLHVRDFGGEAVMTSPGHASGTDRIAEAAAMLGGADIIVNVQGDEPMLDPALLDALVEALDQSDAGCATPVRRIETVNDLLSPNVVKAVLTADGRPLYFSRATIPAHRDLPIERWLEAGDYYAHIGLYAYRAWALERFVAAQATPLEQCEQLEQLRMYELGIPIRCVVASHAGHAVDTPGDVAIVERMLAAGT